MISLLSLLNLPILLNLHKSITKPVPICILCPQDKTIDPKAITTAANQIVPIVISLLQEKDLPMYRAATHDELPFELPADATNLYVAYFESTGREVPISKVIS